MQKSGEGREKGDGAHPCESCRQARKVSDVFCVLQGTQNRRTVDAVKGKFAMHEKRPVIFALVVRTLRVDENISEE